MGALKETLAQVKFDQSGLDLGEGGAERHALTRIQLTIQIDSIVVLEPR